MTPNTSTSIRTRADELGERLARVAADRSRVEAEIEQLALSDQKINGHLHARDELDARRSAFERERRRLLEDELPAAQEREAAAERSRRVEAARKSHGKMASAAEELDKALARAALALSRMREHESAMRAELSAAGLGPREPDWNSMLGRALWAARGVANRWSRYRGPPDDRPVLALALGLPTALRSRALPAAAAARAMGPSAADPLEIRPPAPNKMHPPRAEAHAPRLTYQQQIELRGQAYAGSIVDRGRIAAKEEKRRLQAAGEWAPPEAPEAGPPENKQNSPRGDVRPGPSVEHKPDVQLLAAVDRIAASDEKNRKRNRKE